MIGKSNCKMNIYRSCNLLRICNLRWKNELWGQQTGQTSETSIFIFIHLFIWTKHFWISGFRLLGESVRNIIYIVKHQLQIIYRRYLYADITQEDGNKNHIFKMVLCACHAHFTTLTLFVYFPHWNPCS